MVFGLVPGPGGEAAVGAVVRWRFLVELGIFDIGQGKASMRGLFFVGLEKEVGTMVLCFRGYLDAHTRGESPLAGLIWAVLG